MQSQLRFRAWDKLYGTMMFSEKLSEFFHAVEQRPEGQRPPVMAWTGLTDKNGKEIYEGDFVRGIKFASGKEKAFTGEVRHQASSAVFQSMFAVFEADSDKWLEGTNILTYELEVIGNIYENPELLK